MGEDYWFNLRYSDLMFTDGLRDALADEPPKHPYDFDYMLGYND